MQIACVLTRPQIDQRYAGYLSGLVISCPLQVDNGNKMRQLKTNKKKMKKKIYV